MADFLATTIRQHPTPPEEWEIESTKDPFQTRARRFARGGLDPSRSI